jgi:serine/threonine protein phosphatase 1
MPFLDAACGPDGIRVYAIGDIHGRLDLLRSAHARIAEDLVRRSTPFFRVIHLGDYVDRGPDSADVIEHLIEFTRDGDSVCLAGNHDILALAFLTHAEDVGRAWLSWGGDATLRSYGVDPDAMSESDRSMSALSAAFAEALPASHKHFLESLPFSERHRDFMFVHAGVRPGRRLDKQTLRDVTEIREPFLSHEADLGAVIVHGHTIFDEPSIRPNRIGIDTGAYRTDRLTTLVIEGAEKGVLDANGYAPLGAAAPHSAA